MKTERILTFNHHEAYLSSLASTNLPFLVIEKYKSLDLLWNKKVRPIPDNFDLATYDKAIERSLKDHTIHTIVCHTIKNLLWLFPYRKQRFIFVAHVTLRYDTFSNAVKSFLKKLFFKIFAATHNVQLVAVSQFKLDSWGLKGEVIPLTPNVFPKITPEKNQKILVIGNEIKQRGKESGWDIIESLRKKINITIVGNNPDIPDAIKPNSFDEFLEIFQTGRIFLFTTRPPYNDGYNTAMLEAMQMGMPVVTMSHPSSPIEHGVNGLVGSTPEELLEHLQTLQKDDDLVAKLGKNAMKTIEESFSQEQFTRKWLTLLR